MQVGAVVEATLLGVPIEVWHVLTELGGVNLMNAKRLKARRVNERGAFFSIHPVKCRRGGGVFARVQGLTDLLRLHKG